MALFRTTVCGGISLRIASAFSACAILKQRSSRK
jgi:hypothetical protein